MPVRRARATLPTATFRGLVHSRDLIHARWDEALPVADLAREAGLSPHHFIRVFERAFGGDPAPLPGPAPPGPGQGPAPARSATEACFETGFSSLGSWTSLFAREVGRSPGAFRREMARLVQVPCAFPRVHAPLCFLRHFAGDDAIVAISEKRGGLPSLIRLTDARGATMIQRIGVMSVYVLDQARAKDLQRRSFGFDVDTDVTMGTFRWLTVRPKGQPDLEVALMPCAPGGMLDADRAAALRALVEAGTFGFGAFRTDDCRATYEELKARGVTFRGPPEERPYGIEAVLRDDSGNWFALVQEK